MIYLVKQKSYGETFEISLIHRIFEGTVNNIVTSWNLAEMVSMMFLATKKKFESLSLGENFWQSIFEKLLLGQNNLLTNIISFTFSSITRAMIIGKTSMNPHFKLWNIVIPMMLTLWRNFKRIREKKLFELFSFEKKRKIFEKKNFKVHFRHFPVRNRVWTYDSHF